MTTPKYILLQRNNGNPCICCESTENDFGIRKNMATKYEEELATAMVSDCKTNEARIHRLYASDAFASCHRFPFPISLND